MEDERKEREKPLPDGNKKGEKGEKGFPYVPPFPFPKDDSQNAEEDAGEKEGDKAALSGLTYCIRPRVNNRSMTVLELRHQRVESKAANQLQCSYLGGAVAQKKVTFACSESSISTAADDSVLGPGDEEKQPS
eukprot:9013544-Karenia_brevis.AAC.1